MKIEIDSSDFELIILSSMRYCIGRRTYIVNFICDWLKNNWKFLDKNTQSLLYKDLEEEVERYYRNPQDNLGDSIDVKNWLDLYFFMVKNLDK